MAPQQKNKGQGFTYFTYQKLSNFYNTIGTGPSLGFCLDIVRIKCKNWKTIAKRKNQFGLNFKGNYCLKGTLYYTTFKDSRIS